LRPKGALLPPHARAWVETVRFELLEATGPSTPDVVRFAG
jgi:hypothetical protein